MSHGYGYYGHSKPQINYHQQNTEYVTTVIKEMSRMAMNEKPVTNFIGGDVLKNKVCKEEVVEEKNCGEYTGAGSYYGGGDAVQKHEAFEEKKSGFNGGYKHEAAFEEKSSYLGGGGGALQKQGYKQEVFDEKKSGYHCGDVQKLEYRHEEFKEKNGYNGYHGGGGAVKEKHAEYYKEEAIDGYGNAAAVKNSKHGAYGDAGYAASHYGSGDMHKYGKADAFHYGKADAAAGGYYGGGQYDAGYGKADAFHYGGGCGATQTNSYSKPAAYGGGPITGTVQQHGYYQDAYDHADAAAGGYGGGAYYGGGAMQACDAGGYNYNKPHKAGYGAGGAMMQKHGYNQQDMCGGGYHGGATGGGYHGSAAGGGYHGGAAVGEYNYNYNKAHGQAAKTQFAGGHQYEAYESDCEESDYESDCEEAVFGHQHGGAHHGGLGGGVHRYEVYKKEEKHGGANLGGVRRYEAYERHENLGGGHRYEAYKTTTQEGYGAGGAGYGACASPRKNHFF